VSEHDLNPSVATSSSAPQGCGDRKPYSKPSFRYEQVFETMAMQCGKMQGTSGACNMVKMAS